MERVTWQDRISIDPAVHHGDPCIRGTRVSVRILVGSLADGMTQEEILAEYPNFRPRIFVHPWRTQPRSFTRKQ